MSPKSVGVGLLALLCALAPSACKKGDKGGAPRADDQALPLGAVKNKQLVVPHGRNNRAGNPPCIRRGMEDVLATAKGFATQRKAPAFDLVGKGTKVTPVTLDDPRSSGGVSILIQGGDDTLRGLGSETTKSLIGEGYSSCDTVAFLLPANANQTRPVFSAANADGTLQPCKTVEGDYTKCEVGDAAWISFHEDQYLVATFKNWSDTRERTARIELLP
jgi:hypothetical protein